MLDVEVGKAYKVDGGQIWKVVEVRADGTIVAARWIKSTRKFSGQAYILWAAWLGHGQPRDFAEVESPEAATEA